MKQLTKILAVGLFAIGILFTSESFTQTNTLEKNVNVGGAPMDTSKNIIENLCNSKDHTTFLAALKDAGLVEKLSSNGPFTVFAPINSAFAKLPLGTVEIWFMPENKTILTRVATYHILAGNYSAQQLSELAKKGKRKAKIATLDGGFLIFWLKENELYVSDQFGDSAKVIITDVNQSNGVIHVTDTLLIP